MAWTVERLIRSFWEERKRAFASRPVMGRRTARYLAMASWQASFR